MENKKSLQDFLQNIKPKSKLIVYMLRPEYAWNIYHWTLSNKHSMKDVYIE